MSMTILRTGLVLALISGLGAGAQTWTGSSSPEDLRYRLDVLDAELADIRARLGGAVPSQRVARSGGGGDLDVRIDQLEAQLRQITGRLEQIEFGQRQIAEEVQRRFGDVEFRLTELEGGDISAIATPAPILPRRAPAAPAPSVSSPSAGQLAAVSVSEQSAFERGAEDVRQGRFDQGEGRLQEFLRSYPASPLRSDAHYWLGESRFVRGNMQLAARNFLDAYQEDVSGPRAPQALYRLGVVLGRLGQVNEACLTLREVRAQYPNGPADIIRKADTEADNLACG